MNKKYEQYIQYARKIADVNYSSALLSWDQEVYMAAGGAEGRAGQLATLSGISHELATSKKYGNLLQSLSENSDLNETEKRNISRSLKDYEDRIKYPTSFVEEMSRTSSEAFNAWRVARKEDNFSKYAPSLEKIVQLKKEECEILGYENHPYDALLRQFEPETETHNIDHFFNTIRQPLKDLLGKIRSKKQVDNSFLHKNYNKDKQWEFGLGLMRQMGYNFEAGRQDVSAHPFCISFNPGDVRVTTRINEQDLAEMTWSCLHEGGHALYEQGLNKENYGLPAGEAASLGMHESQSRLWENNVGRSHAYWKANYDSLVKVFPENLKGVDCKTFYKGINRVEPSLIRTNADELTYHFHIMIRFELEKKMIEGEVEVNDLPVLWNKLYKDYLDIDVPSDADGILQDVHWSHGGMGYFPTYTLGSFYAAQFMHKAKQDVKNLESQIEKGELSNLKLWLNDKIHRHGRLYYAHELCKEVTGEPLNPEYFLQYANEKYGEIYNL